MMLTNTHKYSTNTVYYDVHQKMSKYSIYEAFKLNWYRNEAMRLGDEYYEELEEYYGLEVKENDLNS